MESFFDVMKFLVCSHHSPEDNFEGASSFTTLRDLCNASRDPRARIYFVRTSSRVLRSVCFWCLEVKS